jgi:hypothetical protein
MQSVTVKELIARLSGYPPDVPVRVAAGDVDLATCEAELIQGGWEPPFVRIVPSDTGKREGAPSRSLPSVGAFLLLLIALASFIVGYFVGRG